MNSVGAGKREGPSDQRSGHSTKDDDIVADQDVQLHKLDNSAKEEVAAAECLRIPEVQALAACPCPSALGFAGTRVLSQWSRLSAYMSQCD